MSENLFCNINGNLILNAKSQYQSSDDDFRLRYGLYETYLFKNGKLEYEELHWERLQKGMQLLGFVIPEEFTASFLFDQIEKLVSAHNLTKLARIRLQIFTDDIDAPYLPQYLIEIFPLDLSIIEWKETGIRAGILKDFRKKIEFTSNCKISHNKHFLLARTVMEHYNLDDVVLLNEKGNVAESAIANIFWVKDGFVFTPPLSEGCLAGTIRAVVIDRVKAMGLSFEERILTIEDLKNADEVFFTNSIRKIRWVREIDGKFYQNKITKKLSDNLRLTLLLEMK